MRVRVLRRDPSGGLHHVDTPEAFQDDGPEMASRFLGVIMLRDYEAELSKRGLYLVPRGEPFDITLMGHLQVNQDVIDRGFPLVIHDTRDSGMIAGPCRTYIEAPNVIGYLKPSVYRNPQLYNCPIRGTTYHEYLIWVSLHETVKTAMPEEPLQPPIGLDTLQQKLRCTAGFTHLSLFNRLFQEDPPDLKAYRPTDCFFAGTMYYNRPALTLHRWRCVNELASLQSNEGWNIKVSPHRVMEAADYFEQMKRAKCVVSPWGYGEQNFRDIEAALCGAVLIKPDTTWSQCKPDLFQWGLSVMCLPNFTDLRGKIDMIRQEWTSNWFMKMRSDALEMTRVWRSPLRVVGHLLELFDYYQKFL
jgi:hypothetical protein